MKLYFAPSACSLASHIALREADLPFELIKVNNATKETAEGGDFRKVNPKGYVAALVLDNGQVLTEAPALLQYLADLKPETGLAPANGSWERVRLQEMLAFISSEIHTGGCSPLFNKSIPEEVKTFFRDKLNARLELIAATLGERDYLLGERFSVADALLFTILRWMGPLKVDLGRWPAFAGYLQRIEARPSVKAALEAEAAA
ncbi:glutathione transferase GstA [Pseudomonas sp. RIT-PI-AD]|uniref:glutathione transferase GstA n=1 Tax=Pseudomonas sp. RIT-PI-AD TaxID=3035294 RepID=UPI0021DA5E5E|nr:glutathione transferase GstA [Pseudomonas sp. RIT-PI-AD]